jgi:hypothetical protein
MTKKNFIALADTIKQFNADAYSKGFGIGFTAMQLDALADFCESQNPRFDHARWLGYIAGTNGRTEANANG